VQQRIALVFVAFTALLVVGSNGRAQSPEPWMGTWKVNLAKSTYSPGPKPTVAAMVKMEPSGSGFKTTIDAVNAQGQTVHTESVAMFDGKDNPVKGALAPNTTVAFKRIDGRTFEVQGKVDGKPTVHTRVAVSADGTTITATQTGKNVQGQTLKNVLVQDKQ
jgi:hypothetical protein